MTSLPSYTPGLPAGIRVRCDDCGVRGRAADFLSLGDDGHRCLICLRHGRPVLRNGHMIRVPVSTILEPFERSLDCA